MIVRVMLSCITLCNCLFWPGASCDLSLYSLPEKSPSNVCGVEFLHFLALRNPVHISRRRHFFVIRSFRTFDVAVVNNPRWPTACCWLLGNRHAWTRVAGSACCPLGKSPKCAQYNAPPGECV